MHAPWTLFRGLSVHDSPLCPRCTRRAQDIAINTPIAVVVEDAADVAAFKDFVAGAADAPAAAAAAPAAAPAASPAAAPAASPAAAPAAPAAPVSSPSATSAGGQVPASPLARQLAAQMGVDLASIAGTGPGAREATSLRRPRRPRPLRPAPSALLCGAPHLPGAGRRARPPSSRTPAAPPLGLLPPHPAPRPLGPLACLAHELASRSPPPSLPPPFPLP